MSRIKRLGISRVKLNFWMKSNYVSMYIMAIKRRANGVCTFEGLQYSRSSSLGSSCVTLMERRSTRSCRELTRKENECASLNSSPNRSSAYLPTNKSNECFHMNWVEWNRSNWIMRSAMIKKTSSFQKRHLMFTQLFKAFLFFFF